MTKDDRIEHLLDIDNECIKKWVSEINKRLSDLDEPLLKNQFKIKAINEDNELTPDRQNYNSKFNLYFFKIKINKLRNN